jgi:hypothetical protein
MFVLLPAFPTTNKSLPVPYTCNAETGVNVPIPTLLPVTTNELTSSNSNGILVSKDLSLDGNSIKNLAAPTDGGDAANKTYVDGVGATAESNANAYADSLAPNYDAAGSAAQALTDANAYTDTGLAAQTKTIAVENTDWQGSTGNYAVELDFSPLTNVSVQVFDGNSNDLIEMGVNSSPFNGNVIITSNILPSGFILVKAIKMTL